MKISCKGALVKGTIILTFAGLLTRLIGFFYKIYLSNALEAETLGVYQLVFPVYSICFTLYASGLQTAISKLVAEEHGLGRHMDVSKILRRGLQLSVTVALLLSVLLYKNSNIIATRFLLEQNCAPSLRVLALVFPFCGMTACINGYYFGKKKSLVPATNQILEQLARVIPVFFLLSQNPNALPAKACQIAVFGIVIGEIAADLYSLCFVIVDSRRKNKRLSKPITKHRSYTKKLLMLACPLSLNRLLLSLLHGYEAIMIPALLRRSGLTASESLSEYGILNGMAFPFILFASAITNALAVLLLPTVSEADAKKNNNAITSTVSLSVSASLLLGVFCCALFLCFGSSLGSTVFHNQTAGRYIRILAWLCPFLYLTTTLNSILNGLGKTTVTFFISMLGSVLRIILLVVLTPRLGIMGCFISILFGQLLLCTASLITVFHYTSFQLQPIKCLLLPGIIAYTCGSFLYQGYQLLNRYSILPETPLLLIFCLIFAGCYLGMLYVLPIIRKEHT